MHTTTLINRLSSLTLSILPVPENKWSKLSCLDKAIAVLATATLLIAATTAAGTLICAFTLGPAAAAVSAAVAVITGCVFAALHLINQCRILLGSSDREQKEYELLVTLSEDKVLLAKAFPDGNGGVQSPYQMLQTVGVIDEKGNWLNKTDAAWNSIIVFGGYAMKSFNNNEPLKPEHCSRVTSDITFTDLIVNKLYDSRDA